MTPIHDAPETKLRVAEGPRASPAAVAAHPGFAEQGRLLLDRELARPFPIGFLLLHVALVASAWRHWNVIALLVTVLVVDVVVNVHLVRWLKGSSINRVENIRVLFNAISTVIMGHAAGWPLAIWFIAWLQGVSIAVYSGRGDWFRLLALWVIEAGAALMEGADPGVVTLFAVSSAICFVVVRVHSRVIERILEIDSVQREELKSSSDRYRSLVENTHAIPCEYDVGLRRMVYVAPQATKLFGCSEDDLLTQGFFRKLVQLEDLKRAMDRINQVVEGRDAGAEPVDLRVVSMDGRNLHVRVLFSAFVPGEALRLVLVDVTRQKKLEAELQQSQKLESVGRLAAGVAHEINTPIQFVSDSISFVRDAAKDLAIVVERLLSVQKSILEGAPSKAAALFAAKTAEELDLPYISAEVPKALDLALDGLRRVTTIVRSMKEFAHPDRKEMTAVDLNRGIQSTLTIARNEYKYVADLETEFGVLPPVVCHLGDINQTVLNIVINAAHAVEAAIKGTNRKGSIRVRTLRDGADAVIEIRDSGGGIPENVRDKIFDPFFTTKVVGKGTGQGLAMSRSVIVEKHRGQLTFDTELGKGTTFFIRIPIGGQSGAGNGEQAA